MQLSRLGKMDLTVIISVVGGVYWVCESKRECGGERVWERERAKEGGRQREFWKSINDHIIKRLLPPIMLARGRRPSHFDALYAYEAVLWRIPYARAGCNLNSSTSTCLHEALLSLLKLLLRQDWVVCVWRKGSCLHKAHSRPAS